jgi:hypothetical protein
MALTGSGQISLGDIAGEFGGSAPHALSEYHDTGNAPASGEIQLAADFYGTSNLFSYTISSNASQVNLRSNAIAAGWNGSSALAVTINSGVTIYSGSTGSYAMVIDGSYAGGVTLTNNGTILGKGGDGAQGAASGNTGCYGFASFSTGTAGAGGPALQISSAVTIVNGSGRISGGGGGGGGGAGYSASSSNCSYGFGAQGGGGGGGIGNGAAGAAGSSVASAGSAGSLTGAGSGGSGGIWPSCNNGSMYAGNGGAGGSWAASGSNGTCSGNPTCNTYCGSSNGAAGGAATSGASNVTWTSTGTRNGTVG